MGQEKEDIASERREREISGNVREEKERGKEGKRKGNASESENET